MHFIESLKAVHAMAAQLLLLSLVAQGSILLVGLSIDTSEMKSDPQEARRRRTASEGAVPEQVHAMDDGWISAPLSGRLLALQRAALSVQHLAGRKLT